MYTENTESGLLSFSFPGCLPKAGLYRVLLDRSEITDGDVGVRFKNFDLVLEVDGAVTVNFKSLQ